MYGEACTSNEDSILDKGQSLDFEFEIVEREPNCGADGIYPWDEGGECNGYEDKPPPSVNLPSDDHQIKIHVADGVTPQTYGETCPSTARVGRWIYPRVHAQHDRRRTLRTFSKKLSVEFTRAFDNAKFCSSARADNRIDR